MHSRHDQIIGEDSDPTFDEERRWEVWHGAREAFPRPGWVYDLLGGITAYCGMLTNSTRGAQNLHQLGLPAVRLYNFWKYETKKELD